MLVKYYGGKGIEICDEWKDNFPAFALWAYNNGYNDSLELDRIDSNKDYKPSNCRWVNRKVQTNNTGQNRYLTHNLANYSISQCASMIGCNNSSLTNYTKIHPYFTTLGDVIENAGFIGYHPEDNSMDALIFVDKSKVDYSDYHLDYSRKPKQDTPIIEPPKKNYFTK